MSKQTVIDAINESNKIAILPHLMADGDAWGSSLALFFALRHIEKEVKLISEEEIPEYYKFLPGNELAVNEWKKEEWDLAIAVDCGDIRRLGKRKEIFDSAKNTINIDHHETNTKFAKINMVNKNASSVGEMLFDIIKELDEKIDRFTAMCLYVAIATDTGCFKFDSTTFRTHEIAGKLIRTGIDISDISRKLFDVKPLKTVKLMSLMLGTLKLYDSNKIAIAYITEDMFKKTETSLEDTDQFVNMCLDIQGVEVAALIKYQDEHYQKVNLRSCNHYDVSKLANKFGGGGHKRAAGYKSTLPIKELVNVMVREIKKGMQMI